MSSSAKYTWKSAYSKSDESADFWVFHVTENEEPIVLCINGIKTFFGLDTKYGKKKIKWTLSLSDGKAIRDFEEELYSSFMESEYGKTISLHQLSSSIYSSSKYPPDFMTIVDSKASSGDIIRHTAGDIVQWNSIKGVKCTIRVKVSQVTISKDTMYIQFEVIEIYI